MVFVSRHNVILLPMTNHVWLEEQHPKSVNEQELEGVAEVVDGSSEGGLSNTAVLLSVVVKIPSIDSSKTLSENSCNREPSRISSIVVSEGSLVISSDSPDDSSVSSRLHVVHTSLTNSSSITSSPKNSKYLQGLQLNFFPLVSY